MWHQCCAVVVVRNFFFPCACWKAAISVLLFRGSRHLFCISCERRIFFLLSQPALIASPREHWGVDKAARKCEWHLWCLSGWGFKFPLSEKGYPLFYNAPHLYEYTHTHIYKSCCQGYTIFNYKGNKLSYTFAASFTSIKGP